MKVTTEYIWPAEMLRAVREGRASLDYAVRLCRGRRKGALVAQVFKDFMGGTDIEECIDRLCAGYSKIMRESDVRQMLEDTGYTNISRTPNNKEPWKVTWEAEEP